MFITKSRLIFSAILLSPIKIYREHPAIRMILRCVAGQRCNDSRYVHRSRSDGRKCTCFYDTRRIRRHAPSPHLPHDMRAVCALTIIIIITRVRIVASTHRAGASRGPGRPGAIRPLLFPPLYLYTSAPCITSAN